MGLPSGRPAREALVWRGSRGELETQVHDRPERVDTFEEGIRFEEASACYLGRCEFSEKVASRSFSGKNDRFGFPQRGMGCFTCEAPPVNKMTIIDLQL